MIRQAGKDGRKGAGADQQPLPPHRFRHAYCAKRALMLGLISALPLAAAWMMASEAGAEEASAQRADTAAARQAPLDSPALSPTGQHRQREASASLSVVADPMIMPVPQWEAEPASAAHSSPHGVQAQRKQNPGSMGEAPLIPRKRQTAEGASQRSYPPAPLAVHPVVVRLPEMTEEASPEGQTVAMPGAPAVQNGEILGPPRRLVPPGKVPPVDPLWAMRESPPLGNLAEPGTLTGDLATAVPMAPTRENLPIRPQSAPPPNAAARAPSSPGPGTVPDEAETGSALETILPGRPKPAAPPQPILETAAVGMSPLGDSNRAGNGLPAQTDPAGPVREPALDNDTDAEGRPGGMVRVEREGEKEEQVTIRLRQLLNSDAAPIEGLALQRQDLLVFYRHRSFRPAWTDGDTGEEDAVTPLLALLERAVSDGAPVVPLHLGAIGHRLEEEGDPLRMAELDLLLSHAAMRYLGDDRYRSFRPLRLTREMEGGAGYQPHPAELLAELLRFGFEAPAEAPPTSVAQADPDGERPDGAAPDGGSGAAEQAGKPTDEFQPASSPLASPDAIAAAIEKLVAGKKVKVGPVALPREDLRKFYQEQAFRPVWGDGTDPKAPAAILVAALKGAREDGLAPERYHLLLIERRLKATSAQSMAERDVLLSHAFMTYVTDLRYGVTDPTALFPELPLRRPVVHRAALLTKAMAKGQDGIAKALAEAQPPHKGYRLLKRALAEVRAHLHKEDGSAIPEGPSLEPGQKSADRVPILCRRLVLAGDFLGNCEGRTLYDKDLAEAVRRFQTRHGLLQDGIVGSQTRGMLNRTLGERIDTLRANMERWRWQMEPLKPRHIMVNIPGYWLELVAEDSPEPVLAMRVVVGTPRKRTPILNSRVTHLVFNPSWNVPSNIARKSLLPKIQRDLSFLDRNRFSVYSLRDGGYTQVSAADVSWSNYSSTSAFPYLLRQAPGSSNALGRIKFGLPNGLAIYLHDTAQPGLFRRQRRAYSSGCVRVQHPRKLAAALLEGQENWKLEAVEKAVNRGSTRRVGIAKPTPVHLMYWTAFVDRKGKLHYRDDIYGWDRTLIRALPHSIDPAASLAASDDKECCQG